MAFEYRQMLNDPNLHPDTRAEYEALLFSVLQSLKDGEETLKDMEETAALARQQGIREDHTIIMSVLLFIAVLGVIFLVFR